MSRSLPRKPWSLTVLLTGVIWLCLLPLVLLAAWLAHDSVRSHEAEHRRDATQLARRVAVEVDQHLSARIGALQMLAASPLADDPGRWPELYREALGFHIAPVG